MRAARESNLLERTSASPHVQFTAGNEIPLEIRRTFDNALVYAPTKFAASEGVDFPAAVPLQCYKSLTLFVELLPRVVMIPVAITLNEGNDGGEIDEIRLAITHHGILLGDLNLGMDAPAQSQPNKGEVKFLLIERVPVSNLVDDGLDRNAVTEELELLNRFLDCWFKAA